MDAPIKRLLGKAGFWLLMGLLTLLPTPWLHGEPATNAPTDQMVLLVVEGLVEVAPPGTENWQPAKINQVLRIGETIRTGKLSGAVLRSSRLGVQRIGPASIVAVANPRPGTNRPVLDLLKGFFYFFNRDRTTDLDIRNRLASAAVRGTEFHILVTEEGRMELTVIDGDVLLSNAQGRVTVLSGQQGIAEPGRAPTMRPMIETVNIIQWCLYYPGVLDVEELNLSADEKTTLKDSLAAYRSGDLLQALAHYPANREPASEAEKIFRAALLLAVSEVEQAEALLESIQSPSALAGALQLVIAAVKFPSQPSTVGHQTSTATEWLAKSYYLQSQSKLPEALKAAQSATAKSPSFGFAWVRQAELEFSFGRTEKAFAALNNALRLSPRNAQTVALKGFLLSAQNKISAALELFDQAIALDGKLANAWLGRGLGRIRQGNVQEGRADLLTAAALEPQRAVLRSYLGKAFSDAGDDDHARKELNLARKLDEYDPTSWLYSALYNQQRNRINEAVRDLEKSQALNNNRSVYRSRLLLDQDRAVRSANLANIYRDAGMIDVSVREAARAVSADYANYSAHLFLANSYDQLRDPRRINLRYETPAISEYLVANLLAPVGAGTLSPTISQQEYSKLFERDRLGFLSSTEYFSPGNWIQSGAQYGTFGNSSYAFEAGYRKENGQRPNNDFEERKLALQFKQQFTPQDSVYLQAFHYQAEGGDLIQYYDQARANPGVRTSEKQEPIITFGYHHEWNPGMHTLVSASRLSDVIRLDDPSQITLLAGLSAGVIEAVQPITIHENYRSELEIYSTELQQIWQQENHSIIVGVRYQIGEFQTQNLQTDPPPDFLIFFPQPPLPAAGQDFSTGFERVSAYGYYHWQIAEPLLLIAGLSYDTVSFPDNFRAAPISEKKDSADRVSPKAGVIWTPTKFTTVRAAYTRSLGGASFEQSYLLEPSQVAGFNQIYRSLIPESVGGANAGAKFESYGLSLEQKLPTRTYLGASGELLKSQVRRTLGMFQFDSVFNATGFVEPGGIREHIDFEEKSLLFTVNQLIGTEWSFGARYRLSDAQLKDRYPEIPESAGTAGGFRAQQQLEGTLQQLGLTANYNHRCGFFSQLQALWHSQSNRGYEFGAPDDPRGYAPDRPGDDFWQWNFFAGYRFPRRKAEIRFGVLNFFDRDYRLSPLTLYDELPRERTFYARFQLNF